LQYFSKILDKIINSECILIDGYLILKFSYLFISIAIHTNANSEQSGLEFHFLYAKNSDLYLLGRYSSVLYFLNQIPSREMALFFYKKRCGFGIFLHGVH
jgi:hypothetical protein